MVTWLVAPNQLAGSLSGSKARVPGCPPPRPSEGQSYISKPSHLKEMTVHSVLSLTQELSSLWGTH